MSNEASPPPILSLASERSGTNRIRGDAPSRLDEVEHARRVSVIKQFKRAKSLLARPLWLCNRFVLHPLECSFVDGTDSVLPYPPVFIIGTPRSGSTLFYQLLLDRFDFSYLSNLHTTFFGAPTFVERLFHPSRHRVRGLYRSQHGRVKGWCAPSECGQFWYRFFRRRPQFVALAHASDARLRRLRGVIRELETATGKPILFKNMPVALRLEPIIKSFPEAVFLVIKRDLLDNTHSILAARRDLCGSYDTWWAMEPPNIDALRKRPAHEQVVEQVRQIHALIEESREKHGYGRFLEVRYEDFCRDTHSSLERIQRFLTDHGVPVGRLGDVPASFERNNRLRIDENIYRNLREYVRESSLHRGTDLGPRRLVG